MLFFICFALQGKAQDWISTELPNINKLPTKEIQCIFQDSEGYIWYGTEGGLCRDDGYQVNVFRSDFNTPDLLESNSVTSITEDREKKIWFGTKRGVYILDKESYEIKPLTDKEIKGWVIKMMDVTSDGSIWVSSGGFLFRYNASGERLKKYDIQSESPSKEVNSICEDNEGAIWMVQLKGGLFRYDARTDEFIQYPWPFKRPATFIMKDTTTPYYWIGTWGNGVVRFDPREKEVSRMFVAQLATSRYKDLTKKRIYGIAQDSVRHNIWVTTADNLYVYEITECDTLRSIDTSGFLSEEKKMLSNVICDHLGNLWVTGTYPDSYSFIVSYLPNKIINYPMDAVKKEFGVYASPIKLSYEGNYYWIRQKRQGLYVYDIENDSLSIHENRNRSVSFFFEKSVDYDGVFVVVHDSIVILALYDGSHISETEICSIPADPHERIRALYDDGRGNLWIGTTYNLFKYDLKQEKLDVIYEDVGIINDILSSDDGSIYIATESEGFWKICNGKRDFKHFTKENYLVLTASSDQKIWIGTQQGNVYSYNPNNNNLVLETQNCGLIGDVIIDLLADDNGNIWILTDQKITIYNPETQIVNLINCSDPSIFLDNFLSLQKGKNGEMHVGGRGGVMVLTFTNQFEKIIKNESSIGLTSLKINNVQKILDGDSRNIVIEPHETNIELFFSTFDPLNTHKIRYAFRQKKDTLWNYLPVGQNNIYLAGLPKGFYEIEVQATDGNGIWAKNTATFSIQRLPAWYETWWAYAVYILAFFAIVILFIQKYIQSQNNKQQKLMEEQVSQMKYRFFTNVSHELRTPLTLIITPLESIIKKVSDIKIRQQLESVNKNAQNLLSLVNQLLDFRKIEMGGETLSLTKGDINEFVYSVYENFQLASEEKNMDFGCQSEVESLYMFFDASKLRKMINNLLSNALKFTDEGGSILLSVSENVRNGINYIVISVTDTGKGIPAKELSSIFERFHQVDGQENAIGSGIGLHIVKEYANLHGGEISVRSELGKGSTFSVYIPTNLEPDKNISDSVTEQTHEAVSDFQPVIGSEKKILIVEDNNEFRTYLNNELSKFYTVYEAANGLDGEEKAQEIEPDIIITDLMMPEIDGIELIHRIKSNIKISHIPIILLTANDNIENEKRGYEEGADAYIAKPFHWEILLSRIENLMVQKVQRQQIFETEIDVNPKDITISSLDEKLMKKALELIESNISNSEYSVEDLSNDMAMSRSNLYRKIHSITGQTPTDFVRSIRLKKAAELLKEGNLTVVEVAYMVGFNTPGYFTKSFKKMFGVLPTQYNQK
ncbi:two-component regulator propeller domain-containing protein [Dysgonomonas sp. 216]|uniref:hybrid sensor histidine kinase/response regulator transcription factor n=1 Tax=Dysgonomonas sp. 216 TaxID=2302934 RepID=UPI001C8866F9|nr:two-component regulator propeller domain-containing protein [Dysgonomonas sp. 216]